MKRLLPACICLLLAACQAPAPQPAPAQAPMPDLDAEYRELARSGSVYAVDPAASRIRVYVFRSGVLAAAGHNHVLSLKRFEGYVSVPSERPKDARFELRVPLAELIVDDPAVRAETGGNFISKRSSADVEGTRSNMLGEKVLDADHYPVMRLRSTGIEGDWPMLITQVEITLHGVTRVLPVNLRADHDGRQLTASGAFLLRQSDFGMTPFSALGGLMAVQDGVTIAFELRAKSEAF